MKTLLILFSGLIGLSSCAHIPDPNFRIQAAAQLAHVSGWEPEYTSNSPIVKFKPRIIKTAKILTVYIEGDGYAWVSGDLPSFDPTPVEPLALKLALLDPGPAAYIGRPCQYLKVKHKFCEQRYWTSHRFSLEVIQLMDHEVNQLKKEFGSDKLILVGYSGGGAVAALIASRRNDIVQVITVAGNLDTEFWTKQLHLSPLWGSLNPADSWQLLQSTPQVHLIGSEDNVIDLSVVESYRARFPATAPIDVRVIEGNSHRCCWTERWAIIIKTIKH